MLDTEDGQDQATPHPPRRRRRRDEVRGNRVTVRFSDDEYAQLTANAATVGLAVAAYLAKLGTVSLARDRGRRRGGDREQWVGELLESRALLREGTPTVDRALADVAAPNGINALVRAVVAMTRVARRTDLAIGVAAQYLGISESTR